MLTVCVLLYGDYLQLAQRVLAPLERELQAGQLVDLRIGMNAVGDATASYVDSLETKYPTQIVRYQSAENVYKYPLMRRMFYDLARPLKQFTAWFDDDSFIRKPDGCWTGQVVDKMLGRDMVGGIYVMPLKAAQRDWVEDQPWYKGQSVRGPNYRTKFCTGGFWVIRSALLRQYNWPLTTLKHRGGDVMLGELLRQQGKKIESDTLGVAINADAAGNESRSPRRGYDEQPIGVDYRRQTIIKP